MEPTEARGFRRLCILLRAGFRISSAPDLEAVVLVRPLGFMKHETAFVYDNGTVVLDAVPGSEKRIRSYDPDDDLYSALLLNPTARI
ncbi:hypothetical protein M2421_001621 [Stenotrophomonas sp. BIGb0135]|nr:hypothetical protein [Stenotrophomonas sp. BIGb0135]